MTTDPALGPTYMAVALQTACDAVNSCPDKAAARAQMMAAVARIRTEIAAAKAFIGSDLRLVVLPEYFLTAYPLGDTIPGWADKAALDPAGPEYDALGAVAQDTGVFLAGNAYETDPHFPELYFQASFVIDPAGDVILRYRRLNSMYAPTPHDVWDKYLDIHGLDGVFPVADTEIGRLAAIASEEILYPEIARCLAVRGAEIFLHSSSEIGSPLPTPKRIAKFARAVENMAYVVSANSGTIRGHPLPAGATDGNSIVIDHRGIALAESGHGETITAYGLVDLHALRTYRRRPGMMNLLARQRFELFAETYAGMGSQPANALVDKNGDVTIPDRAHFKTAQEEIIARLIEKRKI